MALQVTELPRVFELDSGGAKITLDDPDPALTPKEVAGFYSPTYPELTNAHIKGPEIKDDKAVFRFSATMGTKG
jgi:PRTRC genetic system protein C